MMEMPHSATAGDRGTELVCVAVEAEIVTPRVRVRHNPSFVTQLIATAADLPCTRQRRRAEPIDALAAYAPARGALPIRGWRLV